MLYIMDYTFWSQKKTRDKNNLPSQQRSTWLSSSTQKQPMGSFSSSLHSLLKSSSSLPRLPPINAQLHLFESQPLLFLWAVRLSAYDFSSITNIESVKRECWPVAKTSQWRLCATLVGMCVPSSTWRQSWTSSRWSPSKHIARRWTSTSSKRPIYLRKCWGS